MDVLTHKNDGDLQSRGQNLEIKEKGRNGLEEVAPGGEGL